MKRPPEPVRTAVAVLGEHDGFDNCCWCLFDSPDAKAKTYFVGRSPAQARSTVFELVETAP
jgi:hypothetical protein